MKRLFAALAILVCSAAGAATLAPIQLLNPVGSTAGQAILSTGPNTPPAWTTVSVSAPTGTLPVANGGTGATSAAAARGNLGAAATSSPLSQFAATTSAQLAGVLSDETGTGAVVFGTSPTIVTPLIMGVTDGSNTPAGVVGGYATNTSSGVALTTGVATQITTLSLAAGDWDVSGEIQFVPSAAMTSIAAYVSATTATLPGLGQGQTISASFGSAAGQTIATPPVRFNITTTSTIYLNGAAVFSSGTVTANGFIRARRVR